MVKRKSPADSVVAIPSSACKRVRNGRIETINALKPEDFHARFLDHMLLTFGSKEESTFDISLHFAKNISQKDFDSCFDLIETTSRKDYEASSWQWHPKLKRREMKEDEMRYLIVASNDKNTFAGFLSIMLTYDSSPVVPVLYVYEIHLTAETRGKGLGKHLMVLAEDIARRVGVTKIMLTCFKSNLNARKFYQRLGYSTDASSPRDIQTRLKVHKHDYVIMSKDMRAVAQEDDGNTVSGPVQ